MFTLETLRFFSEKQWRISDKLMPFWEKSRFIQKKWRLFLEKYNCRRNLGETMVILREVAVHSGNVRSIDHFLENNQKPMLIFENWMLIREKQMWILGRRSFVHPSVCPSVRLSVRLSVRPFVHPSVLPPVQRFKSNTFCTFIGDNLANADRQGTHCYCYQI